MRKGCRRLFVAGAAAAALLALAAAALAYRDTSSPEVREVRIPVAGLAEEVVILHVSDLHGERFGPGQRRLSDLLGEERFDAAVMTGDLVDRFAGDTAPAEELAASLGERTDRVYFVRGNHDPPELDELLVAKGAVDLEASATVMPVGDRVSIAAAQPAAAPLPPTDARSSVIVFARHAPPDETLLRRAAGRPEGSVVFLAGHTHGGQIRLPLIGAIAAPLEWEPGPSWPEEGDEWTVEWFPDLRGEYVRGLYRTGGIWVHVSPGLGTTILPFRLFDRAEVAMVRLVPE